MSLADFITKLFVGKTQAIKIQIFRYLIVGGFAFAVDFLTLYLLTHFLHLFFLISGAISFITGLIVNYKLSTIWVFNHNTTSGKSQVTKAFTIFLITGVTGLGINELCLHLFTNSLGINYLISKFITLPIVLMWNFFSRRYLLMRMNNG